MGKKRGRGGGVSSQDQNGRGVTLQKRRGGGELGGKGSMRGTCKKRVKYFEAILMIKM